MTTCTNQKNSYSQSYNSFNIMLTSHNILISEHKYFKPKFSDPSYNGYNANCAGSNYSHFTTFRNQTFRSNFTNFTKITLVKNFTTAIFFKICLVCNWPKAQTLYNGANLTFFVECSLLHMNKAGKIGSQ